MAQSAKKYEIPRAAATALSAEDQDLERAILARRRQVLTELEAEALLLSSQGPAGSSQ